MKTIAVLVIGVGLAKFGGREILVPVFMVLSMMFWWAVCKFVWAILKGVLS